MANSAYFFCKKAENQIAKVICAYYQKLALRDDKDGEKHKQCLDCQQGREILEDLDKYNVTKA